MPRIAHTSKIGYTVRRSDRACRVRVQVTADGVEVIAPRGMGQRVIQDFVKSKAGWIERTLERLGKAEAAQPKLRLEDGQQLPFLDELLTLRISVDASRRQSFAARSGSELRVVMPDSSGQGLGGVLEQWYRERAREEISARLDAATARAGATYERLQIRGQRTRWASCSPTGTMSFNWRLLLAPADVLDYVIEHEVAHIEVLDHSRRFWTLLERRRPGYRKPRAWLRANGASLLRLDWG